LHRAFDARIRSESEKYGILSKTVMFME
jgi:hypothetical protein